MRMRMRTSGESSPSSTQISYLVARDSHGLAPEALDDGGGQVDGGVARPVDLRAWACCAEQPCQQVAGAAAWAHARAARALRDGAASTTRWRRPRTCEYFVWTSPYTSKCSVFIGPALVLKSVLYVPAVPFHLGEEPGVFEWRYCQRNRRSEKQKGKSTQRVTTAPTRLGDGRGARRQTTLPCTRPPPQASA